MRSWSWVVALTRASMKALPKRKGNRVTDFSRLPVFRSLNESPSQKEGKSGTVIPGLADGTCLNESPSQKEGKFPHRHRHRRRQRASMKALPKRKGNLVCLLVFNALIAWPQ